MPVLWDAEVRRIQHPVVLRNQVAAIPELLNNLFEKTFVPPDRQSPHVLENEVPGSQFEDQPDEMVNQRVARVVVCAFEWARM